MDPKEWQRLADEIAVEVNTELDTIEAQFWPEPDDPSFRSFWPKIRRLSDRILTAPAIDIEVKLRLQARIRQITRKARQDQETFFAEHRRVKQDLLDHIQAVSDSISDTDNPEILRSLRQQLNGIRDDIERIELPTRGDRQQVWDTWQTTSQNVWKRLNDLWSVNEKELESLLEQAQSGLNSGNVRETRDLIRRFNTLSRETETSHRSLRSLRSRANQIWREADEVAKAKHEAFMATAGEKVEKWKTVQGRNARAIARVRAEIDDLQRNAGQTDVGAAFARALIEDKTRELGRLQNTNESLEDRIENTEAALTPAG